MVLSYLLGSIDEVALPRLSGADGSLPEGPGSLVDRDLLLQLADRLLSCGLLSESSCSTREKTCARSLA